MDEQFELVSKRRVWLQFKLKFGMIKKLRVSPAKVLFTSNWGRIIKFVTDWLLAKVVDDSVRLYERGDEYSS